MQAGIYFRALEPVLEEAFEGWGSRVGNTQCKGTASDSAGDIRRPAEEVADFGMEETLQDLQDGRTSKKHAIRKMTICGGDTMVTVLAATQYRKSINADTVLQKLLQSPVPVHDHAGL